MASDVKKKEPLKSEKVHNTRRSSRTEKRIEREKEKKNRNEKSRRGKIREMYKKGKMQIP